MKLMHALIVLLVITPLLVKAVIVKNNLTQPIYIHDITFDDKRDLGMLPVRLEPNKTWEHKGLDSLYVTTEDKKSSYRYGKLTDSMIISVGK